MYVFRFAKKWQSGHENYTNKKVAKVRANTGTEGPFYDKFYQQMATLG